MTNASEVNRICALRAETAQARLSNFPPSPPDPVNDRFFRTLSLHSIWDPILGSTWPPNDLPIISFSIGYDQNKIAAAIDSLDLFESEEISVEIASFAHTRVKISSFNEFTIYSDGVLKRRIEEDGDFNEKEKRIEVLNSFPTLTMLTCFTSLMESIYRADGEIGGHCLVSFEDWSDLVNYDWVNTSPNFCWSSKQKVFYTLSYNSGYIRACIKHMFFSWKFPDEKVKELSSLHGNCEISDLIMMQKMADSNIEMEYGESLADFWIRNLSLRKRKLSSDNEHESKKQKIE